MFKKRKVLAAALALLLALPATLPVSALDIVVESPAGESALPEDEPAYTVGNVTFTVLAPTEIDEIVEDGDGYTCNDGVIAFTGDGVLTLTGSTNTRRIVVGEGCDVTIFLHDVAISSGNMPAIEVHAGATVTLGCQGQVQLITDGTVPAIRIAPSALVTGRCNGVNSLELRDNGLDYHTGSFYAYGDGVRYTDPATGGLVDWNPGPVNGVMLENAFSRALYRMKDSDGYAEVHFYNSSNISGDMLKLLAEMAQQAGVRAKVYGHTQTGTHLVSEMGFVLEDSAFYKGIDLRTYNASPDTMQLQDMLAERYENNIKVIRIVQEGELGHEVEVELQQHAPVIKDASNLRFYTYNPLTRMCDPLDISRPVMGEMDTIYFKTTTGGYIIASDGALIEK